MFLSVLGGSVFKTVDPNEERDPPGDPTPIEFPSYEHGGSLEWTDANRLPDFQSLFARVLKPRDITNAHVDAFNINVVCGCSIEQLAPSSQESLQIPTSSDERLAKRQKDFVERLAELNIDNDTAFRTLTRTLPPGIRGSRLAWTRKFWSGLESMSPYWDCSLDQYYTALRPSGDEDDGSSVKQQRLEPDDSQVPSSVSQDCGEDTTMATSTNAITDTEGTSLEDSKSRIRYKGRRTGSGKDMPDAFRSETVRALVEAASFSFSCSVLPPRKMPVVQFNKLNLPVRQTAAVYRVPNDRDRARQGRHEGPLLAVQVRSEIDFHDTEEESKASKSRLDLLREIGGLLQVAQERRREHQLEVKPGEGKWWTTRQRWGGGPGKHEEETNDIVQLAEESLAAIQARAAANSRARPRRTPISVWKELKVGSGHWDPRTDYMAIGRESDSPYDELYMVSSLNHHVSILKLRVHDAYIASMESRQHPDPAPPENDWSRPTLSRSRWYDLFERDDRVEAFTGIWNVVAYLNRDTSQSDT